MNHHKKNRVTHHGRLLASVEFLKRFGFLLFVAVLFLILTFGVAFSQTADKEALDLVAKGRERLKQNDLPGADANFNKALSITKSKNTDVLNAVAEAWLDKPELSAKAKPLLEKSEGIKPTPKASMLLGDIYLSTGNGGQAISNYEHAADLDVRSAVPHHKIGLVYVRSTNKMAALEAFQKAIDVDPTYAPPYKEMAELFYASKNGAGAVKAQEKYIELTGARDKELVRLGYYLFMTKDFAKTNDIFEEAYKKEFLNETSLRYFALSLSEAGDYAESNKIFEEYFSKANAGQVEASDYAAHGKVLLKVDMDSLAVQAFEKSLAIEDKQIPIRQLHAETLFKERRYPEAIASYKTLIAARTKPTSQDLYTIGRAYYSNHQFLEADTTFNKLIVQQPAMAVGYLWAGRTNAELDPETTKGLAKPFYEKVIELSKNNSELKEAYSYLGYYFYVKKDVGQSRVNWEKVLAIDPADNAAKEALKALKQ